MRILLWIIVFIAFFIRIYNINYNTSFLDEAQYVVIGLNILNGNIVSGLEAASWVGGFTFFYPVLTALFYNVGGIIGSRFFAVILGTFSVFLMYYFTRQLLFFRSKKANETAGLIAAAFMAVTTIAVHASRFAIYDSLAIPLFFLGVVLLHKAIYSGEQRYYFGAASVLFISFLAKYITLIYFPILLFIPLYLAFRTKNRDALKGVFLHFCLPLLLLTGLFTLFNFANLNEFLSGQVNEETATEGQVAKLFWEYTGLSYVLFFITIPFLWIRDKFLLVVLLILSFVPLIVHSLSNNTDSIQQHALFSILFILPAIGAGFTFLIRKRKLLGIAITVLVLLLQIFITVPQVLSAEHFWPNITNAVEIIRKDLKPNYRILAESDDSMYLELKDKLPQDQVNGPFYLEYNGVEGIEAYQAAIEDKYFHYIELEGTYISDEDTAVIENSIEGNYTKILDKNGLRVFKVN